ncbi:MAG TPA: ribonuclease D [Acidimicrobiales bacterium]
MPAPEHTLVTSQAALDDLVSVLVDEPRYAIDTEFHRERTYYPKVALVQIAWRDGLALIDPLAVSLEPLAKVLTGNGLAVLHASSQDLEVLELATGTVPSRLFDTQLAAGFCGMSTPSLAALADRELRIRLPKGDRLTDWLARPLTDAQLAYAAADVAHLLDLHDRLVARLRETGRLEWALAECEELRQRSRPSRDPADAWRRIKEVRQLRGRALAIGRGLAAWREERAIRLDLPVRFVLPDLAIVSIAQRAPTTLAELRSLRGVDARQLGHGVGEQILEVVARASAEPPVDPPAPPSAELPRELRPAVTLVAAWVTQLAHDLDIDPALLATRADVEAFLRGDEDARLASGWRVGLVGEPIRRLVAGEVALAFSADHGIELVERTAG